jgi:putative membrane protein
LKNTVKSFWPIALSLFIGGKSDKFETYLGIFIIAISALNLGGSVLSYFRYFIQLEDDAIIIDKGILKRSKTNIPFERIQSINFKQNIVPSVLWCSEHRKLTRQVLKSLN